MALQGSKATCLCGISFTIHIIIVLGYDTITN